MTRSGTLVPARTVCRSRHQRDAGGRGQFRNSAGRVAADEEIGIEATVAQPVAGRAGLQVFGLDVVFGEAEGGENDAGVDNGAGAGLVDRYALRSEEHPSELQSLMRISYAVFCLKK